MNPILSIAATYFSMSYTEVSWANVRQFIQKSKGEYPGVTDYCLFAYLAFTPAKIA